MGNRKGGSGGEKKSHLERLQGHKMMHSSADDESHQSTACGMGDFGERNLSRYRSYHQGDSGQLSTNTCRAVLARSSSDNDCEEALPGTAEFL